MFKVEDFFGERNMKCMTCEDQRFVKDSDGESSGFIDCPECGPLEECKDAAEFMTWVGIVDPDYDTTINMFETLPEIERLKLHSLFNSNFAKRCVIH